MTATYPGALKTWTPVSDGVEWVLATHMNQAFEEIIAIETELGADVAGDQTDLVTRLAVVLDIDGTLKLSGITEHTGIADDNIVEVDGSPNSAEMAVWTANGLDGKTYAELIALWRGAGLIGLDDDDILEVDGTVVDTDMLVANAAGVDGKTYAELIALWRGAALIGIGDDDILEVDGTVAANDIMQATASGLQGLTYAELIALIDGAADWDFGDKDLHNMKQVDFQDEHDEGNSSTAITLDFNEGNNLKFTVTDNCTVTLTAPAGPCHVQLKIINGGAFAITWPATALFPGGTEPDWTASGTDIVGFWYDGTNYHGTAAFNFS